MGSFLDDSRNTIYGALIYLLTLLVQLNNNQGQFESIVSNYSVLVYSNNVVYLGFQVLVGDFR